MTAPFSEVKRWGPSAVAKAVKRGWLTPIPQKSTGTNLSRKYAPYTPTTPPKGFIFVKDFVSAAMEREGISKTAVHNRMARGKYNIERLPKTGRTRFVKICQ